MNKWQKIADEQTPKVLYEFHHPLINERVVLEEQVKNASGTHPSKTAFFDFRTNTVHQSEAFLEYLVANSDIDAETAFRGVFKHELGHYLKYPNELWKIIHLRYLAKVHFEEFQEQVFAYFVDLMDNLQIVVEKRRGKDLRDLYKALHLIRQNTLLSDETRAGLERQGLDADAYKEIVEQNSVDTLLTAYYQIQGGEDLGVELDFDHVNKRIDHFAQKKEGKASHEVGEDPSKNLEEKLVTLMRTNFTDPRCEELNFHIFGTIVSELLGKIKKEYPQMPSGVPNQNADSGWQDLPTLGDLSQEQLEEALDEMIKRFGKRRYEEIRKFVEKETGKEFDAAKPRGFQKGIGIERSSITFYDGQISFYERLARVMGRLYLKPRAVITDVHNSYPEGQKAFTVSDPLRTLNPFSTGGRVLPGITQRHVEKHGTKTDTKDRIPNYNIILDSSGSMTHPQHRSIPITVSYVIANNAWSNGAKVGVMNFSTDVAFLPPTRDLEKVYSLLTAYWGGGTVLNVSKIREYYQRLVGGELPNLPYFSSEQDYEQLLERMHPAEQKLYTDKNITLQLDKPLKQLYESMDNVMITDGGIFNIEEVVDYMNSVADLTRNVIFLLNNEAEYQRWGDLHLRNTQLIHVEQIDDLYGVVLGDMKKRLVKE